MYRVINILRDKDVSQISISQMDRLMRNAGETQFNGDVLMRAMKEDPRIDDAIKNVDPSRDIIEFKTSETEDLPQKKRKEKDTVSKMAKRATKVGDFD